MTQETGETAEQTKTGMLESKFWRTILVLIAGIFVFGGAYLAYVMINLLNLDYALGMASGLILFIVGMILIIYLIQKKAI
jgi:hypothetical protein